MYIGLIFSFFIAIQSWASPTVFKARKLFMEKGRKEALNLIENSLRDMGSDERKVLLLEGEKLATRFRSDEGQREFELGESLYFSEKSGALEHYKQAEKIESQNIQILYAQLRYFLNAENCKQAKTQLMKLKKVWRHSKLMSYYRLRVLECEGKSISFDKVSALNIESPYKTSLTIQALVEKGRGEEALKIGKNLRGSEASFSEIHYWLFRAGELEAGGQLTHLRKYLKLCQSYNALERRSYKLEPRLCSRVDIVRKLIRKHETGGV